MQDMDVRAWLQAVVRVVFDPVVVVDGDVVIEANAAAEALFEHTPLIGAAADVVRPAAVEEDAADAAAGVARVRTASGELRPVRWRCVDSGSLALHAYQVVDGAGAASAAPSPDAERLAALEAGLRNISWELQTLGLHGATDDGGPAVSPEQLRNLSPREREVLRSFLDGCSVSSCARLLHVSEHTVRSHLKSVYRKLGVRSQTELMRSMRRIEEP